MQFLALLRRRTEAFADEDFAALAEREADHVRRLYTDGLVREVWSRGDLAGAAMLLEVFDEADARAAIAGLPFIAAGMTQLTELTRLLPYRGFAPRGAF